MDWRTETVTFSATVFEAQVNHVVATYSMTTATGDPPGQQLPLVPRYVAGVNVTWQAGSRWTHFAELRYNSSMLLSSLTTNPLLRQGSYVVLDLNTSWHLGRHLDVTASLVNALDRKYSDSSANNVQNVSLGLPRVVTVGLRARF